MRHQRIGQQLQLRGVNLHVIYHMSWYVVTQTLPDIMARHECIRCMLLGSRSAPPTGSASHFPRTQACFGHILIFSGPSQDREQDDGMRIRSGLEGPDKVRPRHARAGTRPPLGRQERPGTQTSEACVSGQRKRKAVPLAPRGRRLDNPKLNRPPRPCARDGISVPWRELVVVPRYMYSGLLLKMSCEARSSHGGRPARSGGTNAGTAGPMGPARMDAPGEQRGRVDSKGVWM